MLLFVLLANVKALTMVLTWTIDYVTVSPDGFERRAIGVNKVFPPPAIELVIGDTLLLTIINNLSVPTSLHFHGLYQNNSNYMDGAAKITQCPVPPAANFTYQINAQQTGSYWIHSHMLGQYVDGLRSALIIHPLNDTLQQQSYIVGLSGTVEFNIDWYHLEHQPLMDQFQSIFNPTGKEPIPVAPLINQIKDQKYIFVPGKTYRMRFIGMTALSKFNVWIDGHNMTIIEVDGVDVEPYDVSILPIAAAQRYSVLVKALNQTQFNYNLNAQFDLEMFDDPPASLISLVTATLIYKSDVPIFVPSDIQNDPELFDDTALVPLVAISSSIPDVSYVMDVRFQIHTDGINHGTFNNVVFQLPKVPSLYSVLSMGSLAEDRKIYAETTNPFVLKHLQMVEIIVNNYDTGNHPFHLHGSIEAN